MKLRQDIEQPRSRKKMVWLKRIITLGVVGVFVTGILFLIPRFHLSGGGLKVSIHSRNSPLFFDNPEEPLPVGKSVGLLFSVDNTKASGICRILVDLRQGDRQSNLVKYEGEVSASLHQLELASKALDLSTLGFTPGAATFHLMAQDCNSFLKHKLSLTRQAMLDFSPPSVSLTSTQHYINQGGADVVTYTVSPDTAWSEVRIGPYQFRGYPKGDSPKPDGAAGESFAFFVYAYDLALDSKIEVVAIDKGGNEATAVLAPAKFFAKEFRRRDLPIDDSFISTKVVDIIRNTEGLVDQGDPLKNFLLVNRDLRKQNNQFIKNISGQSEEIFFWKDAFHPLANAAVEAAFADYRNYIYQGQKVDEQVHLGFDLAVTEKYPVYAAGRGKVMFAGYLGIYGNTLILDHGYGLISLYGHLSSMDVTVGQIVDKHQKIGNSGATGLAGGDHLHFSMLIDGVQTNPVEFWDQHWIEDHVYLRLGQSSFAQK